MLNTGKRTLLGHNEREKDGELFRGARIGKSCYVQVNVCIPNFHIPLYQSFVLSECLIIMHCFLHDEFVKILHHLFC